MEMETQCRGLLHMKLHFIRSHSADNPLLHPSTPTYSAYIPDIIIPACRNPPRHPPPRLLSFPRAGVLALLAPSQISQSISPGGGGREAKRRDGGGTGTSAERREGKKRK